MPKCNNGLADTRSKKEKERMDCDKPKNKIERRRRRRRRREYITDRLLIELSGYGTNNVLLMPDVDLFFSPSFSLFFLSPRLLLLLFCYCIDAYNK
jgi:hypothetical protein